MKDSMQWNSYEKNTTFIWIWIWDHKINRFAFNLLSYQGSTLKCLSIGTPTTINFPFIPNGKLMVLGVPLFEHIKIWL